MREPDDVLTSEAARILGCSSETVRDQERRGVLKARRTSTGVRIFSRTDLERLRDERRRMIEPEAVAV